MIYRRQKEELRPLAVCEKRNRNRSLPPLGAKGDKSYNRQNETRFHVSSGKEGDHARVTPTLAFIKQDEEVSVIDDVGRARSCSFEVLHVHKGDNKRWMEGKRRGRVGVV